MRIIRFSARDGEPRIGRANGDGTASVLAGDLYAGPLTESGDQVEVEIDPIGILSNPVLSADADQQRRLTAAAHPQ
jgi:hypothetical protein